MSMAPYILHPLADRSESLELSQVDAQHTDAGRHPIFFGHHVLDGDAKRPRDALEGISWAGAKTISGKQVVNVRQSTF
jgi:hypothetical protein